MNLKFETIVNIFGKIMQLNAVIILKSTNEYNQKIISKSDLKMDLYPALIQLEWGRTHSGFKTQRQCHQKSKTGVPMAPT